MLNEGRKYPMLAIKSGVNIMVNSLSNNVINHFSVSQDSSYDSKVDRSIFTTKLKIEDKNLSNLTQDDKEILQKRILELAKQLNEEMSSVNTNLIFDYEDSISSLVLTIKQADTGKIIRKIPTDEVMELMRQMRDVVSVVLDTKG